MSSGLLTPYPQANFLITEINRRNGKFIGYRDTNHVIIKFSHDGREHIITISKTASDRRSLKNAVSVLNKLIPPPPRTKSSRVKKRRKRDILPEHKISIPDIDIGYLVSFFPMPWTLENNTVLDGRGKPIPMQITPQSLRIIDQVNARRTDLMEEARTRQTKYEL